MASRFSHGVRAWATTAALSWCGCAAGQTFQWTGTNGSLWSDPGNWSNAPGFPNFSGHNAVVAAAGSAQFGTPPVMDQAILLNQLSITNSGDVFNGLFGNHRLAVLNQTLISGNGSSLVIANAPNPVDFDAEDLDVFFTGTAANSGLILNGGTVRVGGEALVNATGVVQGNGVIELDGPSARFTLGGLLRVPTNRTLEMRLVNLGPTMDWNGPFGSTSVIEVQDNATLTLRVPPTAPFRNTMQIAGTFNPLFSWTNEGTINLNDGLLDGGGLTNTGTINTSGDARIDSFAFFEPTSTVVLGGGTLALEGGVTNIDAGASFFGAGTLINRGVAGLDDVNFGLIPVRNENAIGLAGSDITFFETYRPVLAQAPRFEQTADGLLLFVLGDNGNAPGTDFSQLDVSGTATLDGELAIQGPGEDFPAYTPALGDSFPVITALGGVTGRFGEFSSDIDLPLGLIWAVSYSGTDVTVSVVAGLRGDYNDNGQVEQGDLDLVLQNWGKDVRVTGVPTGWTNDLPFGVIEQNELDPVLQNWGSTAVPDFRGFTVPEPAAVVCLGGLASLARLRRRSV